MYVVRRKKRPSVGWLMAEDDLFAFCQSLDESLTLLRDVTVCITTPGTYPEGWDQDWVSVP